MRKAAGIVIAALALISARYVGVLEIGADGVGATSVTALALGFALLAAWIAGDVVRVLRLPRVTGYLLFGVLIGPYLANLVTADMASQLDVVTRVATTLIAMMAGLMLNVSRLGPRLSSVIRVTALTMVVTMTGIAVIAWAAWQWLPIAREATGVQRLIMVLMLAIVATTFSPTMTAAVTADTKARGRMSELVLAMVLLADLALIVIFSMALPLAREAFGGSGDLGGRVAVRLAWEVGGAVAFGVVAGALLALYMRYVAREVTLVLFAACALLSQVGISQDMQPLLAAVAAGVVIENLSPAQGLELRNAIRRGATPALLIFFVWVGTSLRLDLLVAGGAAAALLAGLRILLLRLGVGWGVAAVGEPEVSRYAWTGLVSQAGITLGFAATLASEFPDWGGQIYMLLVSTMAFNELLGPLLFRIGLGRAGEIDDADRELPLIVVSNREPYLHQHATGGGISVVPTTGGVAVALDALMRRRGGVWIAHGGGDADRAVVDADDKVIVPPDAPAYALKRLWIDELTFSAYYGGFANEGLWPLCHQVDVRPTFRAAEWLAYQQVNEQFAAAIDSEMPDSRTSVFIQDYHLALVADRLRQRQPHARTALFWHIPWPHPDRLRICPWDQQLVAGLLANDLLAFQVDRDRRNFLQAVEELPDTSVDRETSQVIRHGHRATVVTVPIGVDFDRIQTVAAATPVVAEQRRLRQLFQLQGRIVGIGVDRLDYTKGIPERLDALAQALDRRPDLRESLTFVQIGVPSRSELRDYAAVDSAIGERVQELNARYATGRPPIIQYFRAPLGLTSLIALYQLAHFCVVSSLHDGMNLVAKEFVAARQDEDGVLVLSSLTGAAQELKDALLINPYDTDGFAEAIIRAVDMPAAERAARMRAMRGVVAGRDVFLWASDILQGLDAMSRPAIYQSVPEWDQVAV